MTDFLYLIWKDPQTRRNFTIGKLSRSEQYVFEYCDQAVEAQEYGWTYLDAFPAAKTYVSDVPFPVFSSRLPDPKRRDINKILQKYDLTEFDDFELLRRSGARLPIDTYEFIDPIFPDQENIQRDFFIMGIRYHAACGGMNCELLPNVKINEELTFQEEPNNSYDPMAIQVLTKQGILLGYVPRYYNQAILERLHRGLTYSCKVLEVQANSSCSECIKVRLKMPVT